MAEKKRVITKKKIMAAAKDAFTSKGFDGTSVDEIAKRAGVTKSLLYYYFESKDDVFYALMKSTMENIIARLGEKRQDSIPQTREETFKFGLSLLEDEVDVLRIAVSEALKTPDKTNIIFQLPAVVFDEFKDKYNYTEKEKAHFCLNAINIITYLSFKETIGDVFKLDKESVDNVFKSL